MVVLISLGFIGITTISTHVTLTYYEAEKHAIYDEMLEGFTDQYDRELQQLLDHYGTIKVIIKTEPISYV